MMFIVDGTGEEDLEKYRREMAGGFCKRLEDLARGRYWRGPTTLGQETSGIADEVLAAVLQWRQSPRRAGPLFLAGHSRGGAAVIFAAHELNKRKIPVDAMFLFDAVNRTGNLFRDADTVPGNVAHCYHAVRDTSLAFYYSGGVQLARDKVARCIGLPTGRRPAAMEDLLDVVLKPPLKPGPCALLIKAANDITAQDQKMKLVMRSLTMSTPDGWTVNFGNCGLESDPKCKLRLKKFLGSHGALGGAPITDHRAPALLVSSDRAAMDDVWSWMSGFLGRHGAFQKETLAV